MVVVSDADAVLRALLRRKVQTPCGVADRVRVLPAVGRDERLDDCRDTELLGGGEDDVLVAGQERSMPGRGAEAVRSEGGSELPGKRRKVALYGQTRIG